MGFLYAIFSPIIWFISFLCSNLLAIFFSLIAIGFGAFLLSYYLYGFVPVNSRSVSPKTSKAERKVTIIPETDEENETASIAPAAAKATPSTIEQRRMRKRDWAKKLYTSFVDGKTPSDDSSNESRDGGTSSPRPRRHLRRRHSSAGPLQMARELIRRGSRGYFRQTSDNFRDAPALPPQEFFEPTDLPEIPQNLQPEIFYILHNLKTLELPSEWKMDPREIEVKNFLKGQSIVKPGEQDDSIYVVVEGTVGVYIAHMEGKQYLVKKIGAGGNFFSLLSMIDILMNAPSIFKTVSLKAESSCKVAKFPIACFRQSYYDYPEAWTRPIQIVITRLLHVTMTTLHQYMGLSNELMKRKRDDRGSIPVTGVASEEKTRLESGGQLKKRERRLSGEKTADQIGIAKRWLAEVLMIQNDIALLDDKISIKTLEDGEVLVEQGAEEELLVVLLTGCIRLSQDAVSDEDHENDEDNVIYSLFQKEIFGGLQLLTNEPSFYTAKAYGRTVVGVVGKNDFYKLLSAKPLIYLPIAHSVLRRLSPFLRGVDYALDWILLDSGQAVYRAGDPADSMYVVLSGRLRSVEKKTVVEEFGREDVLGMMEVLQRKPRSTTIMAVRYSQLARIPEGLLNFIKLQYPQVGFRLVQLLGQYYTNKNKLPIPAPVRSYEANAGDPMSHIKNLHTIAVVPASTDVPLVPFTCELYHALSTNLRVLRLSSQIVSTVLDSSVLEKFLTSEDLTLNADFRLMHWLNVQEDTYPLVIYECDYAATNWTRRCLRQADAILVVANGGPKPQKHSLLRELLSVNQDGVRTNKELILLWPENTQSPRGTYEWLKNSYFCGHHHIRAPKRMMNWMRKSRKSSRDSPLHNSEREIIEYYEKNVFWTRDHRSDFARLARILTGNAIGLVLGGGGARGAAHVGVIRAIREQSIPIDIVGGTSIGSLIGGIYAETPDERVDERAKGWFDNMTSLWRKILDLTWAHSAMFSGAGFNSSIQDVFGEQEIEDLWIPYFCISTDISTSDMRVHRSGPLWAYVRASMSLAGYLPPLCDPHDGHLLLDGGYVNNLPADVMKSMGAKTVIAVDVGSVEESNLYNYGDCLNGFWVLWNKWNPWAQPVRVLNMEEIQSRLAYVSCVRQLETVKKAPYCQYLRPSIDPFKTLDFHQYNVINEVGYEYGKKRIEELAKSTVIRQTLYGEAIGGRALKRQMSRREKPADFERTSSFTDLAAAMSKVPVVRPVLRHSYSAIEPGQFDDFIDDLAFLDHSDAESDLSSQSDFPASETEDEEPRTDTPQPPKN